MNNKFMPILLGISMIFTLGFSGNHLSDNAIKADAEDATVTYKVSTTSSVTTSGNIPTGSEASFKNTYTTANQLTKDNSATLTLSGYTGHKITKLVMSMHSNKQAGSGSFSMIAGSTTLASISSSKFNSKNWYGSWTQDYVDVTVTLSQSDYAIQNGENVVLTIAATANSLFIESYTITYEKASVADSISITDGDQSVTLTEGETYSSKILYTSGGTGDESVNLSSGTDVASLTLDTTNKTISVVANKGVTGTGVYKLVKGTIESAESITVTVNESTTPSISFDYTDTGIDETKMELLFDETYEIPYTFKNCSSSATVAFDVDNENIIVGDDNGKLQIVTCSQNETTDDIAFTVSYSIKDGESVKLTGSLSFTAIAPSIALSTNELVVKEYGSLDVDLTLTGFDTSKVIITLDTGESTNYTASLSEDKSTITLTGLTECADDMLSIDVTDGARKFSDTYTVTVSGAPKYDNDIYTKITSVDEIVDGKYLLVYEETVDDVTTYYAFNGKDEANGYNTNTTVASNGSFDTVKLNITKNSDGTYYLQINGGDNNGKYLNYSKNDNGFACDDTSKEKQTIIFDSDNGLLIKNTGGAAIRFNSANNQMRFRYYKSTSISSQQPVSLYKVDEANTTLGYANIFQSTLSEPCNDVDANNKDSVSAVWTYLANRYNGMPSVVQQQLTSGDSTDETVLTALARYDHIIQRYQLNDFMKRSNSSSRNQMIFNNDTDTAVTIIVVVTLLSVTSIGGYFFIRRRKHV